MKLSTVAPVLLALLTFGCASPGQDRLVVQAEEFRALVKSGEYDTARSMLSSDPRRWWEERDGEGSAWTIGGKPGRWAEWDDHMRSENTPLRWEHDDRSATLLVDEINDYYRLMERPGVTVHYTYFFDDAGKIEGFMISSPGESDRGRTEEFNGWAQANDPDEWDYLRPGGDLDPTGDRAERTRVLANRWRENVGLARIE